MKNRALPNGRILSSYNVMTKHMWNCPTCREKLELPKENENPIGGERKSTKRPEALNGDSKSWQRYSTRVERYTTEKVFVSEKDKSRGLGKKATSGILTFGKKVVINSEYL